jgi:hypothetical protein
VSILRRCETPDGMAHVLPTPIVEMAMWPCVGHLVCLIWRSAAQQ